MPEKTLGNDFELGQNTVSPLPMLRVSSKFHWRQTESIRADLQTISTTSRTSVRICVLGVNGFPYPRFPSPTAHRSRSFAVVRGFQVRAVPNSNILFSRRRFVVASGFVRGSSTRRLGYRRGFDLSFDRVGCNDSETLGK